MTKKLYLDDSYLREFSGRIKSLKIVNKSKVQLIFDQTIFRPSEGGQDNDTGVIKSSNAEGKIYDTIAEEDELVHHVQLISGTFHEGENVKGILDWDKRLALMRSHTGQHILARAIQQQKEIKVKRVHIHPDYGDIILESTDLPWNILLNAEKKANDVIWENRSVDIKKFNTHEELSSQYGDKIRVGLKKPTKTIRVIDINGYDASACTGAHLKQTRDVYFIKVKNMRKQKDELKIDYVVEREALEYLSSIFNLFLPLSNETTTSIERIPNLVQKLEHEKNHLLSQVKKYSEQLLPLKAKDIWDNRKTRSKINICSGVLDRLDQNFLFRLANEVMAQDERIVLLLGMKGENPILFIKVKGIDIPLPPIVERVLHRDEIKGKITHNLVLITLEGKEKPSQIISVLVDRLYKELAQ